ncbi:MAG: glycerol-3-phosphate acyltransferase [Myxococcaceae bacterium]|nr:glycerol-3-phosphate acyltransferase [Myxococcaceae bacterium]
MSPAAVAGLIAFGYLCGSIPFGVVVTRLFTSKDVRAHGSGNIGATNVARVAGKKVGALVLVLDAVKGSVPVLVAVQLSAQTPLLHVAVAYAAFLGHVFPVWLKGQGGKGVATALGVLIVLIPQAALVGAVVWGALVVVTKVSSIGSLAGGLCAIVTSFFLGKPVEYPALAVVLLASMVWTHRGNLQRMVKGTENKV